MNKNLVCKILEKNEKLGRERSNWNRHWQIIGEYVSLMKQDFETTQEPGEFLADEIFDSTAVFALHNSASALMGILWPSNARNSVVISPPLALQDDIRKDEEIWYEKASKRFTRAMDEPDANLALVFDEYMLDNIGFGTCGIGTFYEDGKLRYKPYGVKEMRIDEGRNGRVDACYMNYEWTVRRVIQEYGEENVSPQVWKKYKDGKDSDKVKIVIAYEPREEHERYGEGFDGMPYRSVHIELESKHKLRESGFMEFPIAVGRFRKLNYERYGRSPAMNALPDIKELNALREAIIVATEKNLDPPLGLLNSGMLGGGIVDTSAGALNVFDGANNLGGTPPVFEINTVGDLNTAYARIEELKNTIAQHFALDRLLDFNNQTQMTATETAARSSIRNASLSSLVNRQISEVFTPVVERSFNVMLRNGAFGEIAGSPEAEIELQFNPDKPNIIPERISKLIMDGEDAYEVRYTTPADRVSTAEELQGLLEFTGYVQQLAQTHQEAIAEIDTRDMLENAQRLFGAPITSLKSLEDSLKAKEALAQQAAQQTQLDQLEQVAGMASEIPQST